MTAKAVCWAFSRMYPYRCANFTKQALRALSLTLTETTQAAFEAALKRWYEQYAAFLNEPQRERENRPLTLHT